MATQDRRERRKAQTRRSITESADRLFAARGFDAVTVAEIAASADVAVKTVFNYFPTKEQLYYAGDPELLPGAPPTPGPDPQLALTTWAESTPVLARDDAAGDDATAL